MYRGVLAAPAGGHGRPESRTRPVIRGGSKDMSGSRVKAIKQELVAAAGLEEFDVETTAEPKEFSLAETANGWGCGR